MSNTRNNKAKLKVGMALESSQLSFMLIRQRDEAYEVIAKDTFSIDATKETLKKIKKSIGSAPCHLAIPANDIILKTFLFDPCFKEKEIHALFKDNAEHYFSHSVSEVYYDIEMLCRIKNKVRVVGGKRECIDYWYQLFQSSGLSLVTVSLDVLAVESYFAFHHCLLDNKVYAVFVEYEMQFLKLIIKKNKIAFCQSVAKSDASFLRSQEIPNFIRLYELTQTVCVVTDIIFITSSKSELAQVKSQVTLPVIGLEMLKDPAMDIKDLLSLGMALAC